MRRRLFPILFSQSASVATIDWTGATGHWDASDATTMYTDAGSTLVSADGQAVYRLADLSGGAGNRYFEQATEASRPLYKLNQQNGKSSLLFDGSNDFMTSLALSNFIANNAYTLFVVATPIAVATGVNVFYNLDSPLSDAGGYFGVGWVNSPAQAGMGNYSGSAGIALSPMTIGAAHVFTGRHSGGSLFSQINAGAETNAVSGNTDSLAGIIRTGVSYNGDYANFLFHEMGIFNTVLDAGRIASINTGLMSKWGIS